LRSFDLSDPEREDVSKSNWTSVDLHGSPVGASSFPVCARFQFVGASRGHAKQARPSTEAESPRCINARIRAPTGWDGHQRDCFRVIASTNGTADGISTIAGRSRLGLDPSLREVVSKLQTRRPWAFASGSRSGYNPWRVIVRQLSALATSRFAQHKVKHYLNADYADSWIGADMRDT